MLALAGIAANTTVFDYIPLSIDGKPAPLSAYRGKVLLIVNVASDSQYATQYDGLEWLYGKYKDQGLEVLAFPANDFGQQEPGANDDIKKFAAEKYKVTFPLFAKLSAGGDHRAPLYQFLTDKKANPPTGGPVKWNFTKFLVSREGKPAARFDADIDPKDPELVNAVERLLSGKSLKPELPADEEKPESRN